MRTRSGGGASDGGDAQGGCQTGQSEPLRFDLGTKLTQLHFDAILSLCCVPKIACPSLSEALETSRYATDSFMFRNGILVVDTYIRREPNPGIWHPTVLPTAAPYGMPELGWCWN